MGVPDPTCNPMSLVGKQVMISGASSGLGRDAALLLSRLGATILLVGRDRDRLEEASTRLHGEGHQIIIRDLSRDLEELPAWMLSICMNGNTLDGLVHSAGIQVTVPMRALTLAQVEHILATNLSSSIMLAKAFRQKGVAAPSASLVYISSIRALVGEAAMAVYAASKGGLISLAKTLAIEYARQRIRVNCIAPAFVRTPMGEQALQLLAPTQVQAMEDMHPLGFGTPEDVANAVAFLVGDTGRWITGTTLVVDGGYTAH